MFGIIGRIGTREEEEIGRGKEGTTELFRRRLRSTFEG